MNVTTGLRSIFKGAAALAGLSIGVAVGADAAGNNPQATLGGVFALSVVGAVGGALLGHGAAAWLLGEKKSALAKKEVPVERRPVPTRYRAAGQPERFKRRGR